MGAASGDDDKSGNACCADRKKRRKHVLPQTDELDHKAMQSDTTDSSTTSHPTVIFGLNSSRVDLSPVTRGSIPGSCFVHYRMHFAKECRSFIELEWLVGARSPLPHRAQFSSYISPLSWFPKEPTTLIPIESAGTPTAHLNNSEPNLTQSDPIWSADGQSVGHMRVTCSLRLLDDHGRRGVAFPLSANVNTGDLRVAHGEELSQLSYPRPGKGIFPGPGEGLDS